MRSAWVWLLLSAICLLADPGLKPAAARDYALGVALGLSGTGAPYSREGVEAIELAVEEINAGGGFLGRHPVRLFTRDTRTHPATAEKVVKDLIRNHGIGAVIGSYSSACALAIKPICRSNRVLHIASISNSEEITKRDFSPYTFSVVPNTYMMARGLVIGISRLAREKGWKRYATIASDYAWGRSSQKIQVQLLQQEAPELDLVGAFWPPLGQEQFNALIVAITAAQPDFLLGTIGGTDNAYWMRDARDYRLFRSVEYPGGLISVSELTRQALSIRRGRYGRCRAPFFAHLDNERMKDFVGAYKTRYGRFPTDWAVMSYDAVHILRQGVEKAGRVESERVKDALRDMKVDTTRGKLFFRPIDNQLSCSAYFGRVSDSPDYPIPIYSELMELKGPDIWRPEAEIRAAR